MIHYMSKRDTPLLGSDALCVLGLSHENYEAALSDGRLQCSIEVDNDPTGRLAFHNFWDLLEFSLSNDFARSTMMPGADADFAAQCCDELATDDHDVIAITGDAESDYAVIRRDWIDDAAESGWPSYLLDHCASLLMRTCHHIYAIAAATKKPGTSGRHYSGVWDRDYGAAPEMVSLDQGAAEPLWQERRAA